MGWEDKEIDDLLYRLKKLDKKIPKDKSRKFEAGTAQFDDLSLEFIDRVHKLRKIIKEAQEAKNNASTNISLTRAKDSIAVQQSIRTEIKELNKMLPQMEAIHSKDLKRKKNKLQEKEEKLRKKQGKNDEEEIINKRKIKILIK